MVVRDQFYNGRMKYEPTAVVLRLAPTWFRIGSLEILTRLELERHTTCFENVINYLLYLIREKEIKNLKQVVDFTIEHHMPTIRQGNYLKFLETVLEQSAALVSLWMAHGFTHG